MKRKKGQITFSIHVGNKQHSGKNITRWATHSMCHAFNNAIPFSIAKEGVLKEFLVLGLNLRREELQQCTDVVELYILPHPKLPSSNLGNS